MANENPRLDPIGILWKSAWTLYKERLAVLVQIFLIPAVLFALGSLLRMKGVEGALLGGLVSLIGGIIVFAASVGALYALYKKTDFGTSYKDGFKAFWPFLWLSILVAVVTIGGFVMLIVPGIILAVALAFSQYIFVVENKRGLNALAQSYNYVKGYWWAVLGRILLYSIIFAIGGGIVGGIFSVLLGAAGGILVSAIALLFVAPFSMSYHLVMFENLRRLKPALAEGQAKEGRGFLVASGIVGVVVPILVFILIVVAIGFGAFSIIRNAAQNASNNGGALANPIIFNLDPSKGPVGTQVTVYGLGLAATDTVEFDGLVAANLRDLTVSKDGTITFTVPESVGPDCAPGQVCAQFLKELTPGDYNVTVVTNGVASNAIPYTVTGTALTQ